MKKTSNLQIYTFCAILFLAVAAALIPNNSKFSFIGNSSASTEEEDPPEVKLGERLFRETRFAQYFFAHSKGVNLSLEQPDSSLVDLPRGKGNFPNPYKGSINCATCHFVDENLEGQGMRAYNDFAVRSLVPQRKEDKEKVTPRNSPHLVGVTKPGALLHFDGEFTTPEELVVEGWLGRNFGWLPSERKVALEHMARVIREDDGSFAEDRVSYSEIFNGHKDYSSPQIPKVNLDKLSAEETVGLAAKMVSAYMESLAFEKNSAFDQFVELNGLPGAKESNESSEAYHERLFRESGKSGLKFVAAKKLEFHPHEAQFGALELEGMKIFLDKNRGNCASCHHLPDFTDGRFHNTGVSQMEFDRVHGPGAFLRTNFQDLEKAKAIPTAGDPQKADLGLYYVLHYPGLSTKWNSVAQAVCSLNAEENSRGCNLNGLRKQSFARFKTPSIRDLGHTAPYFHDGSAETLELVVAQYVGASNLQKLGKLREGAKEFSSIRLSGKDVKPLAAFLRSLDEDYN